jgi:hypothetical protein
VADVAEELCGNFSGDPYEGGVECELAKGHEGEHYAEVRWPQYVPRERSEPRQSMYIPEVWAKVLAEQMARRVVERAEEVINADGP